jgi:acetoin utilization deacetylase AcuC-like enzyme
MSRRPAIVFDNRLFRHVIGRHSPENPERLRLLHQCLDKPPYRDRFQRIPARAADMADVEAVHSRFYLDQIRDHSISGNPYSYDKDTYVMPDTMDCALLAAGGCLQLAEAIVSAEVDRGFALVRPPGHHAEPGQGMGFCVLNNVAITAQWLRRVHGLRRILIFDFDVHHCNGTQEVFYNTSDVLVCSFHQNDLFPNTGQASEIGEDRGLGFTVNVPVYPHYGDTEYTFLAGQVLDALVEQYMPQIILVSAGFDGHKDDPISKTQLSTKWFATMTAMLRRMADETCDGRLMMVLEGGYNPRSLHASVLAVLDALAHEDCPRVGILHSERAASLLTDHPAKRFWTF